MILLPIGHEQDTVRRLPVVTFTLMALCIVVFFASGRGALISDDDLELNAHASEAIEYYFMHPQLELDDEFETMVAGEPDATASDSPASRLLARCYRAERSRRERRGSGLGRRHAGRRGLAPVWRRSRGPWWPWPGPSSAW